MCMHDVARACGWFWCRAQEREAGGVTQPFGRAEKGALRPAAAPFNPDAAHALGLVVDKRRTVPHGAWSASQDGEEYTNILNNRKFINGYEVFSSVLLSMELREFRMDTRYFRSCKLPRCVGYVFT